MPRTLPVAVLVALAALPCSGRAEELLSVQPTLFVGSDDAKNGALGAMLNLGMAGRLLDFWSGVSLEAEVSLALTNGWGSGVGKSVVLRDNSSLLRLSWRPEPWKAGEGLSLAVMPFDSRRIYLGYEFPLTQQLSYADSSDIAPGAELRLSRERWYGFVSLKSVMVLNDKVHETYREYTAIAGGGIDVLSRLRLEAEAGYGSLGANPTTSVLGAPVRNLALSGRVLYHVGPLIGPPVDYARYREDPGVWEKLLSPEPYPGGVCAMVGVEGLYLSQQGLASADIFGQPRNQDAQGWAVEARLKWDSLRVYLRGQYRSLSLLLADQPGYPPYETFSASTSQDAELSASASIDYHIDGLALTPGLGGSLLLPATLRIPGPPNAPPGVQPDLTFVFRSYPGSTVGASVLPRGGERLPISQVKVTLRWDCAVVSAIGEAFISYDPNRTVFKDDPTGVSLPVYDREAAFGFNLLVQARF